MWTLLLLTLPTQPAAVRLRVWRNLKALGSEPLRDGAYLLPSAHDGAFTKIAEEVIEHGGTAFIAEMKPRLKAQDDELNALFDRTAQYTQWFESLQTLRADIKAMTEVDARRRYRTAADSLLAIERIDYLPGEARVQANTELASLKRDIDTMFSAGEPNPHQGEIPVRSLAKFQGKRWATRARPWVDRMACAWLISRGLLPVQWTPT